MQRFSYLVVLPMLALFAPVARAQDIGAQEVGNRTSYYRHVRPGDISMEVSVWGSGSPGRYEIPVGMDLGELLTLTGLELPERSRSTRRSVMIRIMRDVSGQRSAIFETSLDSLTRNMESFPVLQDEDIVAVEQIVQSRLTWREAVGIAGTGLSLLSLILQIVILTDRL